MLRTTAWVVTISCSYNISSVLYRVPGGTQNPRHATIPVPKRKARNKKPRTKIHLLRLSHRLKAVVVHQTKATYESIT